MKAKILVKNAIRCKHCGDIIESTYRHDFRYCSCHRCAVDGGLDYLRRCGSPKDYEDMSEYKEVEMEPKYKRDDTVDFEYYMSIKVGVIQVVGTFPNSVSVYYDILVESEPMLYKQISENDIIGILK